MRRCPKTFNVRQKMSAWPDLLSPQGFIKVDKGGLWQGAVRTTADCQKMQKGPVQPERKEGPHLGGLR